MEKTEPFTPTARYNSQQAVFAQYSTEPEPELNDSDYKTIDKAFISYILTVIWL